MKDTVKQRNSSGFRDNYPSLGYFFHYCHQDLFHIDFLKTFSSYVGSRISFSAKRKRKNVIEPFTIRNVKPPMVSISCTNIRQVVWLNEFWFGVLAWVWAYTHTNTHKGECKTEPSTGYTGHLAKGITINSFKIVCNKHDCFIK